MLVSDVYDDIVEITGQCDQAVNFRALTRAVQLLAAKDLFDPQRATLDFTIGEDMTIALPRDVKAPIRININGKPSFARQVLFEFASNTDGTVDGEEVGWAWADRGRIPINNELPLPATLKYLATSALDDGSAMTVWGLDDEGNEIEETLIASSSAPIAGVKLFARIIQVRKAVTTNVCKLLTVADSAILAEYYPDETAPSYRIIKLSKKNVSVRMLYRRHTYKVSSLIDVLPIDSELAITLAVKAVRYFQLEQWDLAAKAEEQAVKFAKEEQASRNEHVQIGAALEVQSASNRTIDTRDSIKVADVYDLASEIFGAIGRDKVFDRITDAVEALSRKAPWNPLMGVVDIVKAENITEVNKFNSAGNGYYVLPRIVEGVMAVNVSGQPMTPRNQWHEFHMNGFGETNTAPFSTWDDHAEVVTINRLPLDPTTREVIPHPLVAIPELSDDDGTEVRVFGIDENGKRLMTGTEDGILIPCVSGSNIPTSTKVARIDRITKEESSGFIRLWTSDVSVNNGGTTFSGAVADATAPEILLLGLTKNSTAGAATVIVDATYFGNSKYIATFFNFDSGTGLMNVVVALYSSPTTFIYTDNQSDRHATFTDVTTGNIITINIPENCFTVGAISGAVVTITSVTVASGITAENDLLLGYWEPDETEPKYRAIILPTTSAAQITVMFRRRQLKVTSLYQPLFLRSRLAIENMMRSIKVRSTDPASADEFERAAVQYLGEEALAANPTFSVAIQVVRGMAPGINRAI